VNTLHRLDRLSNEAPPIAREVRNAVTRMERGVAGLDRTGSAATLALPSAAKSHSSAPAAGSAPSAPRPTLPSARHDLRQAGEVLRCTRPRSAQPASLRSGKVEASPGFDRRSYPGPAPMDPRPAACHIGTHDLRRVMS